MLSFYSTLTDSDSEKSKFEIIYNLYKKRMWYVANEILNDPLEAEDAVQGNSVTNAQKKAWLSSGYELNVPQFIKTGEKIIVDTKTGKYVGRN